MDRSFVQENAEIIDQEQVSSRYFHLSLHAPQIAKRALPGQFVMISCQGTASANTDPLLPRPLAILRTDPQAGSIHLLYFIAGKGTALLNAFAASNQQKTSTTDASLIPVPSKSVRIIGPLGTGFTPCPDVDIHLGVGGGSGVAPLVFFLGQLSSTRPESKHLILAARSHDQLPRRDLVSPPEVTLHETTDDGTAGFHGNAVDAMKDFVAGPGKAFANERIGIYVAGPEPMMLGAAKAARELGLPCRVSLEERMACGIGVCRACVVDGTTPHPKTNLKRRTVCQDGPVFDTHELAGAWSGT